MSSRNGSRRLLTGVFFSGIYRFVPGQGGEGGGAATKEQSSPLGRKYAGGEYIDDFYLGRKSEIGNCKGWLAIAKLKSLSLFVPLLSML